MSSSLLRAQSQRPLSALRRFSCTVNCANASAEEKPRFIHPSSVVHPSAILADLKELPLHVGRFNWAILYHRALRKVGEGLSTIPWKPYLWKYRTGRQLHSDDVSYFILPGRTPFPFFPVPFRVHIFSSGAVIGDDLPGHTVIGRNNIFGHHAVIGVKCQDLKYKFPNECFIEIGDNNEIREHVSIHRSSSPSDKTVIGDNNLIMGSCHIAHDCKVGNNNILANSTLLAGHVVVEDYAHTAGGIVVHQFSRIGSFSFIGGGSVVSQDVPKYTMVSGERAELRGLNLEGLRRRGFSATEIKSLRAAYRKIFMPTDTSSGNIEDRLTQVEQHNELSLFPAVCSMVQSIRDSFAEHRRGICKFRSWDGS